MVVGLINANPVVYEKKERRSRQAPETTDENAAEAIDQLEIFDVLSSLTYLHAVYLFFPVILTSIWSSAALKIFLLFALLNLLTSY